MRMSKVVMRVLRSGRMLWEKDIIYDSAYRLGQ